MNKIQASPSKIELLAVYLAFAFRYLYPLILVPYYGRVLGASGYAMVLAGMSLSNTLFLFVTYGFPAVGARDIVQTGSDNDGDSIFRDHFTARLLLCIPGAGIGIIAVLRSELLSSVQGAGIFVVAGGLLGAFNLGWYFTSTGRARTSVLIEMLGFVLSLTLLFTFIRKPADIDRVFPLIFISNIVQLLLAYWTVRKEFSGIIAPLHKSVNLVKRSTIIFIYNGTSILLLAASAYILALLAPTSEVSAFGISERLVTAGLCIMGPAAQILVPRVMFLVTHNRARANQMTRRIFTVFFLGAIAGVIITILLSGWLVPLIFGPEFSPAVPVLNIMVFVLPISVCARVLAMYFMIPRKLEGPLARSGIISALVNVTAAIPLATYWGAAGMAQARLLGEFSLLVMVIIGIWRAGLIREMLGIKDGFSLHTRFGRWLE